MPLICPPRKIRATMATMAMRARISAYSASPWPSSSFRSESRNEVNSAIDGLLDVVHPQKGRARSLYGAPDTPETGPMVLGPRPGRISRGAASTACRSVDRLSDEPQHIGEIG